MSTQGLLFIPDISGFTRFVNDVEIEHSRLIIQELLELLIDTNEIGLEVSEIEGDAILFFRFGQPPSIEELYGQVEKMFVEFHRSLYAYDQRKYCQCKACLSAVELSLKIITHYGEFTDYNVRNFKKLIGKDIIVAHQLLKNDIPQHEYWLLTTNLQDTPPEMLTQWMNWNRSEKQTEGGIVPFHYTLLTRLKDSVNSLPIKQPDFSAYAKMFSVSREYDSAIIPVFHASGDFNHRHRWMEGIKKTEQLNHFLPRIGMKFKVIYEDRETTVHSSSYSFGTDRIEFSETDEKTGDIMYFILESINEQKTRLTIDYLIKKNFLNQLSFRIMKQGRIRRDLLKSMDNLEPLAREPGI